jgi:tetratricopeptide (TPR) repeat protein
VYHAQKKYSQAKWFNLQAANLSRAKNNIPELISSLIELASIKVAIKDYKLAIRDLNEALALSSKNHYPHQESAVMQSFALLYSNMKNYTKETVALKRRDEIEDSIKRAEEAKLIAKVDSAQDSLKIKDSVIVKKKVSIAKSKKNSKGNYTKKLVSL